MIRGRKKADAGGSGIWRKLSFGLEFDMSGGVSVRRAESKCDDATKEFCLVHGLEGKPVVTAPFQCIVAFRGEADRDLDNAVRIIFSEHLDKCEHAFHLKDALFKSQIIVPDHPHPSCPFNPLEPFVQPPVKPGDWPQSPSPGDFPPDDGKHMYVVTDASIKLTEDGKSDLDDNSTR